jgi:hypothetical protein
MPDPKEIAYKTPFANWETRAFWEGAGRHELVLQRCGACDTVQHRPRGICASCLSSDIEHFVASGRGTVYSCTVTHQNQLPGFREAVPYVLAYVDLEEGPRLMTNVVGCAPEDVHIGMAVRVEFVDTEEQLAVPRFVPA